MTPEEIRQQFEKETNIKIYSSRKGGTGFLIRVYQYSDWLESKYIELERLKEYPMTHQGNCGKWQGYTLVEYRACTCGLDEILKPQTP